ncbi:uncharacterized protein LOC129591106 [Paramacrobiotus metropolitanus]|uniref:uncharacterized protein LOC129591106 n=1 Tax=Paramacrobiotus metropolitanus TaxID=2943436 RepID=UPI0024462384|nr:uncharacterized protein LOC129591106 [Paramacrobiotus metropolitanus]
MQQGLQRAKRIFAPMCALFVCSTFKLADYETIVTDGMLSSTPVWSWFVPNYSGTFTLVGNLNKTGWGEVVLTPNGNPFIMLDPRTGDVILASGYCPRNTVTWEFARVQGRDVPDHEGMQGILAIGIYSPPEYVNSCQGKSFQPPTALPLHLHEPVASWPPRPTSSLSDPNSLHAGTPDVSFNVDACPGSSVPIVVGSFPVKFSPYVDFTKLRMTITSRHFLPVFPVVCNPDFQCNITIVFSRPIDQFLIGKHIMTAIYECDGLSTAKQLLMVYFNCHTWTPKTVPPPTVASDPPLLVPELPPCSAASIPIDVNEDTPVGTVVTSLPSIPSPGFRFQIIDASATGYFNISDQGAISVARPLSEPTVDSVYLRAAGQVDDQSVCGTDVFIGIKNVNLRKPEFDQVSYSFNVDCNQPSNPVGTVSASDSDRGRNNIRRFFLKPEDTAIATVDPASGILRLRSKVRESTTLLVFVDNPGTNLTSSAIVHINCTGDNSLLQLGGLSGRGAQRPTTTTQNSSPGSATPSSKVDSRAYPAFFFNPPVSHPFTVLIKRS